ncbi:MAG: helix-turn-helix domain-containing protein [Oscillospiraceae bacterium]|nr:helix-turn-helix domain-containing protein [Oscillospiraceae bacterium]
MTQDEFAKLLGTSKQNISRYENGEVSPKISTAAQIAEKLGLSLSDLNGGTPPQNTPPAPDLIPVRKVRIPLLGDIAAGEPVLAVEEHEEYIELDESAPHSDYALRVISDSMEPTIHVGDTVFIRQQDDVDDGRIAAVLLDDSATLKRIFHIKGGLQLLSDNAAKYPPRLVTFDEYSTIRILGMAVAYRRNL